MKSYLLRSILFFAMAALAGCAGRSPSAGEPRAVSVSELNSGVAVIGELGVRLGTLVTIEATIVDGDELGSKMNWGSYLLKVTKVDGNPLNPAPMLHFYVFGSDVDIEPDHFSLYEMKTGKKTGELNDRQIRELNKGYVGRKVRLLAYEEGAFYGNPTVSESLWDCMIWQSAPNFCFQTRLAVMRGLPETDAYEVVPPSPEALEELRHRVDDNEWKAPRLKVGTVSEDLLKAHPSIRRAIAGKKVSIIEVTPASPPVDDDLSSLPHIFIFDENEKDERFWRPVEPKR